MTDLEKALITIREECKGHDKCDSCPLRVPGNPCECMLVRRTPSEWKLIVDENTSCTPSVFVNW